MSAARSESRCSRISTWSSSGSSSRTCASRSSSSAGDDLGCGARGAGRGSRWRRRRGAGRRARRSGARRPGCPAAGGDPRRRPTPRRGSAAVCRNPLAPSVSATRESTQSRVRACSIATSKTTPSTPVLRTFTLRSSIWPTTRVSVERFSKRRMFSRPVVITWPASMLVTRVIGAKIWRRPNTSTTRPTTRGCRTSDRSTTTTSRTLPTWSPWGSNTGSPARRAAKTRMGVVLIRCPAEVTEARASSEWSTWDLRRV